LNSRTTPCDIVSFVLLVGTLAATAALFGALPAEVATQFDAHGLPEGLLPRAIGAFLLPFCAVGVWLLLRVVIFAVPSEWSEPLRQSPTALVAMIVVALVCGLQGASLYVALADSAAPGLIVGCLRGGLWIGFGILFPRIRKNPWVGVCTPWALASDESWTRTQRFAGQTLAAGGAAAIACTCLGQPALAAAALIVSAVAPGVYSYLLPRERGELTD